MILGTVFYHPRPSESSNCTPTTPRTLEILEKPAQGPAVAWLAWQAWNAVTKIVGFLARRSKRKTVLFSESHQRYELMIQPIGICGCGNEKAPPDQSARRGVWGYELLGRRVLDPPILLPQGGEAQAQEAHPGQDDRAGFGRGGRYRYIAVAAIGASEQRRIRKQTVDVRCAAAAPPLIPKASSPIPPATIINCSPAVSETLPATRAPGRRC